MKGITVRAKDIPGAENVRADWESRRRLDPVTGGWIPLVDLFAVRHNTQLPPYFNFKPDLGAVAVDAFAQDWLDLTMYVFPPFLMVGRCLQKTREEKVEKVVIVGPLWKSQAWYHPRKHQQSLAFFTSRRIC